MGKIKKCYHWFTITIEIYVIFFLKITFSIQNDYLKLKIDCQKIFFLNLIFNKHLGHNSRCSLESTAHKQQFSQL